MMPSALGLGADHEAGDVLQIEQRQAAALGVLDEVGDLARRFGVDDAADARTARRSSEIRGGWRSRRSRGPCSRACAHNISGAYSG